ncbi:MAG: serine/threonine-protein phosphatase [Spirochaetia bacterium]|nr:serine/threonine-protein phosphatase [Spirochaetia bacterium]
MGGRSRSILMRVLLNQASLAYFRGLGINAGTILLIAFFDPVYGSRVQPIPFAAFVFYYLTCGLYLSYRLVRGMHSLESWFDIALVASLPVAIYYGYLSIELPAYAVVFWIWGTTVGMPGFGFIRRRFWLIWMLVLFAASAPGFFIGALEPRNALWMVWMVILTYYMTETSNHLKKNRRDLSQNLAQSKKNRRDLDKANRKLKEASDRFRAELVLAGRMQQQLLPPLSGLHPRLEIVGRYLAMENVGGDFYDVLNIEGRIAVLVADVTGHGVAASLITTMTKAAFHNHKTKTSAGAILKGMNQDLCAYLGGGQHFVSAACAIFEPESNRMHFANAGHPPPLHLSSKGISHLGDESLILGVDSGITWDDHFVEIATGDRFLFYTDGVTETRSDDFELYEERLEARMQEYCSLPPEEFLDILLNDLKVFRGNSPQTDDIALLCFDVR